MSKAAIYQIFYSAQTCTQLDPGFLALDNTSNERPDWREYWPMRRFLLRESLRPETYYGFFSSKFGAKTGLTSVTVHELIEHHAADADVISFSPYLEHSTFFRNSFEQAVACHGQLDVFRQCAALIAPEFRVEQSVMTSLDTIFCNFFVAKPEFWREWLRHAERLFQIAEEGSTPLARTLNAVSRYSIVPEGGSADPAAGPNPASLRDIPGVPLKVFVIERLASLLLWSNPQWKVKSLNHLTSSSGSPWPPELFVLDALKIAYRRTGTSSYLDTFDALRRQATARYTRFVGDTAARINTVNPSPQWMLLHKSVPAETSSPSARSSQTSDSGPERIRIVCATRRTREQFVTDTQLGHSLSALIPPNVELRLFPNNSRGLPAIYNVAIEESRVNPAILLFIHDDVYLNDVFWSDRLRESLDHFQLIGVIGNRRRAPRQPSWLFRAIYATDDTLVPDDPENLSGTVTYGDGLIPKSVDAWGPPRQSVKLLDGLFLAARSTTLQERMLRFDERFDFHFYDLDFCRQAERAGLEMGTWPISVTHGSAGNLRSAAWRRSYDCYLDKWVD